MIDEKAISIYEELCKKARRTSSLNFIASRGWFNYFHKRAKLHTLQFKGEAASADQVTESTFPAELKGIIFEGGLSAIQVFSADKTGVLHIPRQGDDFTKIQSVE